MNFWLTASCLTVAATLAVLIPITRRRKSVAAPETQDMAVYQDQLKEIDTDLQRNLIDQESAEQARLEIARRLIKAERRQEEQNITYRSGMARNLLVLATIMVVPVFSWGIYTLIGSPNLSAQPLAQRMKANPDRASIEEMLAKAEMHLKQNPDDARGWVLLAPIYLRTGRLDDALIAYQNVIRLNGEEFGSVLGLGETLVAKNNGIVTADAKALFEKAAQLNAMDVRPPAYLARYLMQENKRSEAADLLEEFANKAPENAAWLPEMRATIQQMRSTPSPKGPTSEDVEAAKDMSENDRNEMIAGMVAGLDQRLRDNPDDVNGWQQLVRSYIIMNKRDEAQDALNRGIKALDAEKQKTLAAFAKSFGLNIEGSVNE